jgi:hypothetical protein
MGNKNSSSSSSRKYNYSFEPLVDLDHSDEVQARIAEALHCPSSAKKDSEDDEVDGDRACNPADTGSVDFLNGNQMPKITLRRNGSSSNSTGSTRRENSNFDPFCNLKSVEGWSVVIHTLSTADTLAGLSLKYDVSTDDIRKANFMADDRLISFSRLIIPIPVGSAQDGSDPTNDDPQEQLQKAFNSPVHRTGLVQLLSQMDSSNIGNRGAEYYLSKNGFNLREALNEAETDANWERTVPKEKTWKLQTKTSSEPPAWKAEEIEQDLITW